MNAKYQNSLYRAPVYSSFSQAGKCSEPPGKFIRVADESRAKTTRFQSALQNRCSLTSVDLSVTNGYMTPKALATIRRQDLGLTQQQLAEKLKTTRVSIARYETGARRIPGVIELMIKQLSQTVALPMAGIVAAGKPIEAVEQNELIDIPPAMIQGKENFVLKVTGESMRDDGILPGDFIVVRKQSSARNGERVVALINGQATVKTYHQKVNAIELRPVNTAMQPVVIKPTDDLQIQGVVVGLMRYYKS